MKEEPDLALIYFNKALKLDSLHSRSYSSRGALYYYFLDKDSLALKDFNTAIRIDSLNAYAYFNRALTYRVLFQHDKSIKDFTTYIQLNPKDFRGYYERGYSYNSLLNYKASLRDLKKAKKKYNTLDHYESITKKDIYKLMGNNYYYNGMIKKGQKFYKKSS